MTSLDMSILFCSRSELVSLTYLPGHVNQQNASITDGGRRDKRGKTRYVRLGPRHVLVDENHPQNYVDDGLDEQAVVSPDRLDTLGVHLVVLHRQRPEQTGEAQQKEEQVW